MATRSATPPITPPTIAPTGVDDFELPFPDEEAEADGRLEDIDTELLAVGEDKGMYPI